MKIVIILKQAWHILSRLEYLNLISSHRKYKDTCRRGLEYILNLKIIYDTYEYMSYFKLYCDTFHCTLTCFLDYVNLLFILNQNIICNIIESERISSVCANCINTIIH